MRKFFLIALPTVFCLSAAGCYVENESAPEAAASSTADASPSQSVRTSPGAGSHLAPTRRAADRTVGAVEARQRDIERKIDEE